MTQKVRYVLWRYFDLLEGWWSRAVFQLENGVVTGMAPEAYPPMVAEKNYETAVMLAEMHPDRNRLVDLDEGTASVMAMECRIMHEKSLLECDLPVGTYFTLWSIEDPGRDLDGSEEAAYGRVVRTGSDRREFVVLGTHKSRSGPLEEAVFHGEARVRLPKDLRPGEVYTVDPACLIPCSKNEIRVLRVVEKKSWDHHPDPELDMDVEGRRG